MTDSALLGVGMGAAHAVIPTINAFGGAEKDYMLQNFSAWQRTIISMQRAATTYLTKWGFNAIQNQPSGANMQGLVSTILAAGITDSALTRAGFNRSEYDGAFNTAVGSIVDNLVGGFTNAWLASVMMNEPLNPGLAFTLSLGRLIAQQLPDGDEMAAALGKTEVDTGTNQGLDQEDLLTQEQAITAQAGAHRVRTSGQRLPQMSNEEGYARGVEDTIVEPSSVPKASAAKQKNTTWLYERSKADAKFRQGNKGHQRQAQVDRWEEEEEEEIIFEEIYDRKTGNVIGYNAYQNGKPVVPPSQRGVVEVLPTESIATSGSKSKATGSEASRVDKLLLRMDEEPLLILETSYKAATEYLQTTDGVTWVVDGFNKVNGTIKITGRFTTGLESGKYWLDGNMREAEMTLAEAGGAAGGAWMGWQLGFILGTPLGIVGKVGLGTFGMISGGLAGGDKLRDTYETFFPEPQPPRVYTQKEIAEAIAINSKVPMQQSSMYQMETTFYYTYPNQQMVFGSPLPANRPKSFSSY